MGFQADSELCAETLGGDSCQGDSGGPLFGTVDGRRDPGRHRELRPRLRRPAFPGVYGEVNNASIRSFISATAGV